MTLTPQQLAHLMAIVEIKQIMRRLVIETFPDLGVARAVVHVSRVIDNDLKAALGLPADEEAAGMLDNIERHIDETEAMRKRKEEAT